MADDIRLTAETGRAIGTRPARRLRAEGKIPAVVYGSGTQAAPVAVDWKALRAALTTDAGLNALITLDVDGDERLTLVKEMQRHPVRRDVTHVDFVVIDRDIAVEVEVPVHLVGEPDEEGFVVDQVIYVLPISAKPGAIPNEFTVDITALTLDTPITVADLDMPDGVEPTVDPDEPVVSASIPETIPDPDAEAAEALDELAGEEGELPEGEEGAEGAGAEGEAGEASES